MPDDEQIDFEMTDIGTRVPHGHRSELVRIDDGGGYSVAATVFWRNDGEVFLSVEDLGGRQDASTVRRLIAHALRDALREKPPRPDLNLPTETGPKFLAGRGLARSLARALKAGNASIVNPG